MKIKKNAVTKAKLKKGSVNSSKIADGSITGTDINAASTPFGQIVHEARGSSTVPLAAGPGNTVFPLENSTYTQPAGRDDLYVGALDVTFPSTCESPRQVSADILVDPANPLKPATQDLVAVGGVSDEGSVQVSLRINMSPSSVEGS